LIEIHATLLSTEKDIRYINSTMIHFVLTMTKQKAAR
jgi:hypothetical protein